MRIVAGSHRGRALVAPKGHSTRPTADRTRQALFDVLEHAPWSGGLAGRRVIDLFAGAGALGIEALSRGAAFCLLIDTAAAARAAIEGNLRSLGLAARARVAAADAARLSSLPAGDAPFDLAFLDPPYGGRLAEPALTGLLAGRWLSGNAVVAVEQGAGEPSPRAEGFSLLDQRTWGRARISFLSARLETRGALSLLPVPRER